MLSQGVAWFGRLAFLLGVFLSAVTIVGQSASWIATAEWLKIDVIKGLASFGIGPMHSDLKGLDLILSYIDETPFSIFSALTGVILFGFMSWLAQRKRA